MSRIDRQPNGPSSSSGPPVDNVPPASGLPLLEAVRYETPLREGGSLPAVVEASDGRRWVMKFRAAGQGPRALVAEVICAGIARAAGLPVPEIALLELPDGFGRTEPDPEIQDLLRASAGLNLGVAYLAGSLGYDAYAAPPLDPFLASCIVWFDAFATNVDRTPRNVNLLLWEGRVYMIDHGATLYFHHSWRNWHGRIRDPFPAITDHVLLPFADALDEADSTLVEAITPAVIAMAVDNAPSEWLPDVPYVGDASSQRAAYRAYLGGRLAAPRPFVDEIRAARRRLTES